MRLVDDARIVAEALTGTGTHIDHQDQGGGYPSPTPTSSPFVPSDWDACMSRVPRGS